MKRLWLLGGLLVLPIPTAAAPVLVRDLISAGGISAGADSIALSGSVGGYAFGLSAAAPEILVIEGFWFPGLPGTSGLAEEVPTQHPFRLDQNFPNPCRRQTTIRYSVPGRGNGALPVRIEIFDVQGRRVALLADAPQVPGEHTVQWNGRDAAGHRISAGVYYCCLRAAGTSAIKTLVVLK